MVRCILFWGLLFFLVSGCKKAPATETLPGIVTPSSSRIFYVAPGGSDTNNGSKDMPWKTLNAGIAKLLSGDTLFVRGGVYSETLNIDVSGTASRPITIMAYPGESTVIDGKGTLPVSDWNALVNVNGSYIHLSGFEVKNTVLGQHARGVNLEGHHNTISKFNVHHTQTNGILVKGDFGVVEDSEVWQTDQDNAANPGSGWASGLSAARDPVNGISDSTIIRRNIVHDNWGEGLSTYEAEGTLIEDNIVYDNYAQNVYISDASNVVLRRNLIYNTPNNIVKQQIGAALADEVSSVPRSSNNTIVNNIFFNVRFDAFAWTIVPGSNLKNVLIANNTFVNSPLSTNFVSTGNRIINNIFTTTGTVNTSGGIVWQSNLWQQQRPLNAVGVNDIVLSDPLINATGLTTPGNLTAEYFKLTPGSPAINQATKLTEVTEDYFKKLRGVTPDIGAHEF